MPGFLSTPLTSVRMVGDRLFPGQVFPGQQFYLRLFPDGPFASVRPAAEVEHPRGWAPKGVFHRLA